MDELASFMGRNGLLPHSWCLSGAPGLLWSMVAADAVTALAYFSIPLAILSFTRQRGDVSMHGVARLFVAFIFACGLTHVMDVWTIWRPDYGLQVLANGVTAVLSLITAVALWRLIPQALRIPSIAHWRAAVQDLQAEVGRRRTAEDHLADLQQSLALTLSTIGAGFVATDRRGQVTRLNDVAERVLGWAEAEARGRSIWEVFNREDRPPAWNGRNPVDVMVEMGPAGEGPRHLVALARDGSRTEVELRVALTRADDGAVRGLAMVFRDLTAERRAEAESSRLAAIVESSNDAIISKSLDGRILTWNRAAAALFGYSAAEAIGQPVQMLIPPEREAEEMRILAELALGHPVPVFDTERLARDGARREVSVSISPIRDASGRVVAASKIARDISRQRQAEAALRDSEARLRFTLESAQIGDWDLDLATGAERRSERHDRCFGYAQPQPDWSFGTFLSHVHDDDRDEVRRQFDRAIASLGNWGVECRVVWPDGSVHWISLHGSIRHENGRPTRMLGIVTDITQYKLAEQARLDAQRLVAENLQIQEAHRLKTQFLANMSHELRTPLNAVIGFADLLRSGAVPPASPKYPQFLTHIGDSGRHLLQLINDVLDLSKVESGKFEFFPEPLDLAPLVHAAVALLDAAAQRKRITVSTHVDPDLVGLVLDPGRLKQVIFNYLSNAIKFTPEGGQVAVRARPEGGGRFRLEVEDNGIGIAAADLRRLFTDFLQLDAGHDKQHAGTGLGLALTRRLVQAQGGRVGVHSAPGVGSVFFLVLDRVATAGTTPATDAVEVEPLARRPTGVEPDTAPAAGLAQPDVTGRGPS